MFIKNISIKQNLNISTLETNLYGMSKNNTDLEIEQDILVKSYDWYCEKAIFFVSVYSVCAKS